MSASDGDVRGREFDAIGTGWTITTGHPVPDTIRHRILALADDFDRVWSRFRSDSLVTRIAHAVGGGRYEVPERDVALLELYDRLVAATNGAVDPLVGRDLELLGYDAGYTLIPDREALALIRHRDRWATDVQRTGRCLNTTRSVVIDVGAAGKGFLVDLIVEVLVTAGFDEYLVDGSGDLRHRGTDPVVVGLEHPSAPGQVIGTVELRDGAVCASATGRRAWGEGLHHVLNGHSRLPVDDVIATWAMTDNAATADGLATALFVSAPERLLGFEFQWVRMLADGRIQWSNDFPGELFI
jgi:thiamine biosynthesis lipoprotein